MANRTVALDFDGCLHPYTDGWLGQVPANEAPDPLAVEFLVMCATRHYDVVIFSCRASDPEGCTGIWEWLAKYGLTDLVADVRADKPLAFAYVDDRAVPFRGNWLDVLEQVEELAAQPTGAIHRV